MKVIITYLEKFHVGLREFLLNGKAQYLHFKYPEKSDQTVGTTLLATATSNKNFLSKKVCGTKKDLNTSHRGRNETTLCRYMMQHHIIIEIFEILEASLSIDVP